MNITNNTLGCILLVVFGIVAISISVGHIYGGATEPAAEYVYHAPPAPPVCTPTPSCMPTPNNPTVDIAALKIYDRDSNGKLDKQELGVIETDYHYKRLTDSQIVCLVNVLGYTPTLNPTPSSTPKPTVVYTPLKYPAPDSTPDKKTWYYTSTNPIPTDYYSHECLLPTDQSMQEYLSNSDWVNDYDAGGWDCSQMSAYMEFMLESCGYNTIIRVADMEGEDFGHAWILIEFSQGWLAYECTDRYWVYPSEAVGASYETGEFMYNPSFYTAGVGYDSIHDVWGSYSHYSNGYEVFLEEYGWWI